MDMFNLENDLPDELISSNTSWPLADNIGNPKPPAQGPGPGAALQNGIENAGGDGGTALRQQIQLNHMLQQQVKLAQVIFYSSRWYKNLLDLIVVLYVRRQKIFSVFRGYVIV